MAKFGSGSFGKAPKVSGKLGSVPGDASRSRINEAGGQKVTNAPGAPIAGSKDQTPAKVNIATGDDILMPVNHPNAKTTRTVKATSGI